MPRPVNRPVECWQPIVSASPRGLDFMVQARHQGRGRRRRRDDAGRADHRPISDAAARAGKDLEARREPDARHRSSIVAKTREQALREITPLYEEHAKMFAPLGFVPGLTPEQVAAVARRGGWDEAGVPTVEHYIEARLVVRRHARTSSSRFLKGIEERYPGMEHINLSIAAWRRRRRDARTVPDASPRRSCRISAAPPAPSAEAAK